MLKDLSMSEQRYRAVLAVVEDGLPVTDVAAKVGVSRQTLHSWLARYAGGRLEGLADRSHRPASCPHQMDAAVEVRLVELRGLHPGWGSDRLRYRLGREGLDPVPSRAAVGQALARLGLVHPGRRRPGKRTYRRWERGRPMELWQMVPSARAGPGHVLRGGTTFDDVLDLYVFDRALRLLVMDALERVEVAVRATLIDHMSTTYDDAHWYTDASHFGTAASTPRW